MKLEGKKIGFALTGSFCTLSKVIPEIGKLAMEGAEVVPIISESVDKFDTKFGKADEWKKELTNLTGKKIINTIVDAEPIGPKALLDLIIVAPCTGNTLGKLANAVTDTPVTMAVKAHLRNNRPVVIAISTNDGLGNNAKNIGLMMNMKNVYFAPFGQDDPMKKTNSLVAKWEMILPTALEALDGRQIEPVLM